MYFPDLTPYEYGHETPPENVLNVGWLSARHEFPVGIPDERLVKALRKLVRSPVNPYRGWHVCEFCPNPPSKILPGGVPMPDPPPDTMGDAEIRVIGRNGITYVAPVLVLHYVVAHRYAPPPEFVEAVIERRPRWLRILDHALYALRRYSSRHNDPRA